MTFNVQNLELLLGRPTATMMYSVSNYKVVVFHNLDNRDPKKPKLWSLLKFLPWVPAFLDPLCFLPLGIVIVALQSSLRSMIGNVSCKF